MEVPELVLANATVVTQDPARPRAAAVAVAGGRVIAVGDAQPLLDLRGAGTRVLDCAGGALLPGFHDAHLHLLAMASRMVSVDCSPGAAASLDGLRAAIARRAAATPRGEWVRAWGYDETALPGGRHPTRGDLDAAAPDHPVRLKHRSGHASVLNTLALERAGLRPGVPDPPGGVVERDPHGEPTGVLIEMDDHLDAALPPMAGGEMEEGLRLVDRWLLSRGITAVQDATPTNDPGRWGLLRRLKARGLVTPRVVFMPGVRWLEAFRGHAPWRQGGGAAPARGAGGLLMGPAKLVVSLATGAMLPDVDAIREVVEGAEAMGFAVAVHAVEAEVAAAAARAMVARRGGGQGPRHRIEHASELPDQVLEMVRDARAVVATNPGFVHFGGDRYLRVVEPAVQPWLYRLGSLARAGVRLAFGSDAPVEMPEPMAELHAAVTRRTSSGRVLGEGEGLPVEAALAAQSVGGAWAAGLEGWLGRVSPGMAADLVLLDRDPTAVPPDGLLEPRPLMTLAGGRVVWEA